MASVAERKTRLWRLAKIAQPLRRVLRGLCRPFAWVARARGWRWLCLVALECLAATFTGVLLWVETGRLLYQLPDVGDPFDVAAFQARKVTPRDNAFVYFERAFRVLEKAPRRLAPQGRFSRSFSVHPDDPEVGEWLLANRKALARFLEGCASSAAQPIQQVDENGTIVAGPSQNTLLLTDLVLLAVEEGARREARGDMDGAWACYYAVLRGSRLIARHGSMADRASASALRGPALQRLSFWAADPRTSAATLRRALDDLYALDALEPDDATTLKFGYLDAMRHLKNASRNWEPYNLPRFPGQRDHPVIEGLAYVRHGLRRWRLSEPDRSIRVVRMMTAQWLAYFDAPAETRPAPAFRVVIRYPWGSASTDFFAPGPDAPAAARALGPEPLAEALAESLDIRNAFSWFWGQWKSNRSKERSDHFGALFTVADALYRREHNGNAPESAEHLLGKYLKALPEEPLPLADDPTPRIDLDP
jgi:hypothetical protein